MQFYPRDYCKYRLPVMPVKTIPGNERLRGPMVTISSEAFALVLVKNCWDKWTHIIPKKAENSRWEIPKYDAKKEETHKCHSALWSDGRNGQKKGQGWTSEGYTALLKQQNGRSQGLTGR